jgi:hypothetical protein
MVMVWGLFDVTSLIGNTATVESRPDTLLTLPKQTPTARKFAGNTHEHASVRSAGRMVCLAALAPDQNSAAINPTQSAIDAP